MQYIRQYYSVSVRGIRANSVAILYIFTIMIALDWVGPAIRLSCTANRLLGTAIRLSSVVSPLPYMVYVLQTHLELIQEIFV